MFEIIATLDQENPGSMINMLKYFYLVPKLKLREFSTLEPKFIMNVINTVIKIMGLLLGWKRLVGKFKN